jgi:hypothetical protein
MMMVDDDNEDDDNQTNTLENTEMPKSSLSIDNLRLGLDNHGGYSDQRSEKVLQARLRRRCCNINRIDNILKNMHSKWSNID